MMRLVPPNAKFVTMLDPIIFAQAVGPDPSAPASLGSTISRDAANIAAVPGDIGSLPFFVHLSQALPAIDVAFGGGMLMLIILVHATGIRAVMNHVARRVRLAMLRPNIWRADAVMSTSILLLLALHLVEVIVWATALVYSGLVKLGPDGTLLPDLAAHLKAVRAHGWHFLTQVRSNRPHRGGRPRNRLPSRPGRRESSW